MNIPFWNPHKDYLIHKAEIDEAIQRVLSSGDLMLGTCKEIEEFEEKFAKYIGVKHAIMVGGGTHALKLAYKALIKPGDEVITTSHTFIATIDQIVDCGGIPVLVDIDSETGLIDPSEVERAITPRTKAIVPVHLEGKVCDLMVVRDVAEKHNLLIIEDSAQAVGAKGIGFGDAMCFSFYPAKILGSVGNGGMVTTNDDQLAERIRMLRCNSNIGKNSDMNAEFGVQMEPDGIQAAVLNVRFKYLEENLKRRAEIAKMYLEGLKELENRGLVKLPPNQEGRVWQDFVLRVPNPRDKEELVHFLNETGIGLRGHTLIPNHDYKVLSHFKLPKTSEYIKQQIRIPCNRHLTDEEVQYIISKFKEFYEKGTV